MFQHRLLFDDEDSALDTQTNIEYEAYGFTDQADCEEVDGRFQVTFQTARRLTALEQRILREHESPDAVGFNEDVSE